MLSDLVTSNTCDYLVSCHCVTDCALSSMQLRVMTAYGPQEDDKPDNINNFYQKLEEEIIKCEEDECGLVIELDANAKIGNNLINGDPNTMSENGRILWNIAEHRKCTIVNTSEACKGTITRSRTKKGRREESVLDYVIVNQKVAPYVKEMIIDESKDKALTSYKKKKKVVSDHNILICSLNIPHKRPKQRHE